MKETPSILDVGAQTVGAGFKYPTDFNPHRDLPQPVLPDTSSNVSKVAAQNRALSIETDENGIEVDNSFRPVDPDLVLPNCLAASLKLLTQATEAVEVAPSCAVNRAGQAELAATLQKIRSHVFSIQQNTPAPHDAIIHGMAQREQSVLGSLDRAAEKLAELARINPNVQAMLAEQSL